VLEVSLTIFEVELSVVDGTIGVFLLLPEGEETEHDLVDLPDWVPGLRVVRADGKADTILPSVESSVLSDELNLWWLGWELWWADNLAEVETTLVFFLFQSEDNVVPDERIFWIGEAHETILNLSLLLDLGLDIFLVHLSFSHKSHLTLLVTFLHFS